MIRLSHRPLGQYNPPYFGSSPNAQRLDPLVRIGLEAAGQILSKTDPGIPKTVELIERIIVAPPMFSGGAPGGGPSLSRVSDINPWLNGIAISRENPWIILGTILAIPIISYMLGRKSKRA